MEILFSEMANQFQFLYFVMSRSVYQVMMNSFSVFYFDQLGAKVSEATSVQFRSMLALINSSHNETKRYSNPCHAYIFSILSSSTGLLRNLKYYVNPTLATLGLCQNILCIVVLNKDGFSKTSNLNLLSVIVAGSFQQLLSINIAEILEFDSGVDIFAWKCCDCHQNKNHIKQTFQVNKFTSQAELVKANDQSFTGHVSVVQYIRCFAVHPVLCSSAFCTRPGYWVSSPF
nr:hypothetical protein BgiMline_015049 [Biomphalaria glabrata]